MISVSGIRGITPGGLDSSNVVPFIHAFAEITGKKILIARDTRPSSVYLHGLVVASLMERDKNIVDCGIIPTPTLKYMVHHSKGDAAIMISASHNPTEWNGLKFIGKNGLYFDHKIQKQWIHILKKTKRLPTHRKAHRFFIKNQPHLGKYLSQLSCRSHIDSVIDFIPNPQLIREKNYRVVVDAVNGAGQEMLPELLESLGCEVIRLHCNPFQGNVFPRSPEPSPDGLKELSRLVKKEHAAIGFALDPDADRLVVASPAIGALNEEYTLPLAMLGLEPVLEDRHSSNKKNYVVVNLSTSSLCEQVGKRLGIRVFRAPVGEMNVFQLMRKKNALLGGEGNGGVILPNIPSFGRDPLAGSALILQMMAFANAVSLDDVAGQMPPLFMHKSKHVLKKSAKKRSLKDIYHSFIQEFPDGKTNRADGLHISISEGNWIHIRPSNTEPILRLILEGRDQNTFKKIKSKSLAILS